MRVLLAIDDSEYSRRAVDAVRARQWPAGTIVRVITIVDPDFPLHPVPYGEVMEQVEERKSAMLAAGTALAQGAAEQIRDTISGITASGEADEGYIKERILDISSQWGADLVVLGSQGRRGLAHIILGSVSQAVLLHSTCPVMIVKKPAVESAAYSEQFQRVMLALDNSRHSQVVIDRVLGLPWHPDTMFRLVHVLQPFLKPFPEVLSSMTAASLFEHHEKERFAMSNFLQKALERFQQKFGGDRASYAVLDGEPRSVILKEAEEWPAGLIFMGSHGRNFMERFVLGSVSQAVALQAPCSIEVVKMPVHV